MTQEEARQFAERWIAAWNRHDVDEILSHYADGFEMITPMIQSVLGTGSGALKGKKAVGEYWRAALRKVPDLQFSLIDVACGVGAISIYYHSVMGRKAIEMFFINNDGKVRKAVATYT